MDRNLANSLASRTPSSVRHLPIDELVRLYRAHGHGAEVLTKGLHSEFAASNPRSAGYRELALALARLVDQRIFFADPLPVIAILTGAVRGALCCRRYRLAGARGYGVWRTLLASAMFSMAPFKTALMRRAGATRASAAGEWIADPMLRFQTIYW